MLFVDEKLRVHQATTLQTAAAGVLREEDIEKIKSRHREEMKLLSAENDDLHQRKRQLESDLQLHRESLDVTIRYKIDLEKALEEKTFLQHELDRLKHERDLIEQEKIDYKSRSDNLQEEIRILLSDRSKIEQKLNGDLQEQIKQRQRTSDDVKKYKTQIEQLNIKLGDAEARLLVLQTQNEALIASKDREIKNEFETLTQRLNYIESEKHSAEQRYHNEHKEIASKQQQQQHVLHEPLVIVTSGNALQHQQHSPYVFVELFFRIVFCFLRLDLRHVFNAILFDEVSNKNVNIVCKRRKITNVYVMLFHDRINKTMNNY